MNTRISFKITLGGAMLDLLATLSLIGLSLLATTATFTKSRVSARSAFVAAADNFELYNFTDEMANGLDCNLMTAAPKSTLSCQAQELSTELVIVLE